MAGVAKEPGRRQSSSHIVALLSLKILLLAFFILLNALSTFEEGRRTAVVDSVRQAFQGVLPAQFNVDADPAALDIFEGAKEVVDALHQLFADDLPILVREESPGSWTLRVDLPIGDLFAQGEDAPLPEGAETLRLVGAVLGDPRFASAGYHVDVLYGIDAPTGGSAGNRRALTRAGVLVRELERQGLLPARLSTGFLPDFAGRVRLHFTIRLEAAAGAATAGGEE